MRSNLTWEPEKKSRVRKAERIDAEEGKARAMEDKNLTIADIAQELGVSKTTVSRAISGKGRIGEQTRNRVLAYIEAHHYSPNVIAKGLAQNKTFNLGMVLPGDYNIEELPFFQKCMLGISRAASEAGYDVLISMVTADHIAQLERAVTNRKVDGVILTRTLADDVPMRYLEENGVPFVAIGSTGDAQAVQIDNDHKNACRELTGALLDRGIRKIALIGGSENYIVTKNRMQGFLDAFEERTDWDGERQVFLNVGDSREVDKVVERVLTEQVECVVCMDDFLCGCVLNALQQRRVAVPEQMQVASFYDSSILANRLPAVTSIRFDVEELGRKACELLLRMLDGEETGLRTLLGYEVCMRESTK